jgi:hypothetical protein
MVNDAIETTSQNENSWQMFENIGFSAARKDNLLLSCCGMLSGRNLTMEENMVLAGRRTAMG